MLLLQADNGGAVPQNWSLLAETPAGRQMLMFPLVDFMSGSVLVIISIASSEPQIELSRLLQEW